MVIYIYLNLRDVPIYQELILSLMYVGRIYEIIKMYEIAH